MLEHLARTRRCHRALKSLGRLQGVTGEEFLRQVSGYSQRHVIIRAEIGLFDMTGAFAETLPVGPTLVVSYDASLRDEPLDNTLYHEAAHILLGHLEDERIDSRLQSIDGPGHDIIKHWGARQAVARSHWDREMERDAETVAQLMMMRRSAVQERSQDPRAARYLYSLRSGNRRRA